MKRFECVESSRTRTLAKPRNFRTWDPNQRLGATDIDQGRRRQMAVINNITAIRHIPYARAMTKGRTRKAVSFYKNSYQSVGRSQKATSRSHEGKTPSLLSRKSPPAPMTNDDTKSIFDKSSKTQDDPNLTLRNSTLKQHRGKEISEIQVPERLQFVITYSSKSSVALFQWPWLKFESKQTVKVTVEYRVMMNGANGRQPL